MTVKNHRNNYQDHRLDKIEQHVSVINGELGTVKIDLAIVKTTQKTHTWLFGLVVAGLVALIFKAFA